MNKTTQIIEHIVVTFVESAVAYLVIIPTTNWTKTALAGAVGAGLSAAYNIIRQSSPTMPPAPPSQSPAEIPIPVNVEYTDPNLQQGSVQNTNTIEPNQ